MIVKHDMVCDKCGKPATRNTQVNVYKEYYDIKPDGSLKKIDSDFIESEENEFYCKDCEWDAD